MATDSARAIISDYLNAKGLGGLGTWAWERYLESGDTDLVFLQIKERDEYKTRFRGKLALAEMGRAITEDEQIAIEGQMAGVMRAAGLPAQFYDNWDDFQDLISADKSPSEVARLVNEAYVRVTEAPPEVRSTMAEFYGTGSDQALAAYILDPTKALPAILHEVASAELGGELARQGITIQQGLAERAARMSSSSEAIAQGSQDLGKLYQSGLFDELAGETDLDIETGVMGTLGREQDAQRDVEQRIQTRKATTGGETSTLFTQQGVAGAGSAPQT